jgi:hypothetical protein
MYVRSHKKIEKPESGIHKKKKKVMDKAVT